ncbi:MAG: tripartite tricarboxylate transporter substrate binding protein [Burkholderiales bacterium]
MSRCAMDRRRFLRSGTAFGGIALASAALGTATVGAMRQALAAPMDSGYPDKAIQLIIPFAAGGPTDMLGRFLSKGMTEDLGQPMVALNRPGAGGNIGTEFVGRAAPDGYTLLLAASSHVINPSIYPDLHYDPVATFAPISLLATGPFVLTVREGLPVNSVSELIALARSKPGGLTYSSAGTGTGNHLAGELFKQKTGVNLVHVPYNGAAPASQAILTGVVDILFNNMLSGLPMIRAKQVRALAVTGPARSPALPDVPTIAESAVPGFDVQTWYALLAPAGLSGSIQTRLNASASKALSSAEGRKLLDSQGLQGSPLTPQQVSVFLATEQKKWSEVAKLSGAKVD